MNSTRLCFICGNKRAREIIFLSLLQTFGSYCFLPFGYGWNSPYGYSYGRDLWYFRLPSVIYNQPPPSGIGTTTITKSRRDRLPIDTAPPYERIQTKMERTRIEPNIDIPQSPSIPASQPVYTPPAGKRVRDN